MKQKIQIIPGMSKNDSVIYEFLVTSGESVVGVISSECRIHRRNVYDSIQRLSEKGFVYEVVRKSENAYIPVHPRKLHEGFSLNEALVESALPSLNAAFSRVSQPESVNIYKGVEGWKRYLRDILRTGQDVYIIGGKGAWADPGLAEFTEHYGKVAARKGISNRILFDNESKKKSEKVLGLMAFEYRYLPKGFETKSAVDVFGDSVVVISDCSNGKIDENVNLAVIRNQKIADSFRVWFKLLWKFSK